MDPFAKYILNKNQTIKKLSNSLNTFVMKVLYRIYFYLLAAVFEKKGEEIFSQFNHRNSESGNICSKILAGKNKQTKKKNQGFCALLRVTYVRHSSRWG